MNELTKLLSLLDELRRRVVRVAVVVVALFGFFLTFEFRWAQVSFLPFGVWYPYPSPFSNFTVQVFDWLRAYELPPQVVLINIDIGGAIVAQMELGLLLAVSVSMPWIVHELGAFLMPALRLNERALIRQVGIPATVLFVLGFMIGLLWITPFTFLLLFKYIAAMGLAPDLTAQSFLEFALLYTLAFGIVFELPVFVYSLTRVGLINGGLWRKHWRAAVIGCLVFGMIVTPDNSGITMLLIATPMVALYFGGMFFAERYQRKADQARLLAVPGGTA